MLPIRMYAFFLAVILICLNPFWLSSGVVREVEVIPLTPEYHVGSVHNPSNHGKGYDFEVGGKQEDLWHSHHLRSSIRHMSGADTYAELGGLRLIAEQAEGRERKNRAVYNKKEPQEASSNSTTLASNSWPKIEFKKKMNKEDGSSSSRKRGATPLPEKILFYLSDIWESTKPWTNVSTVGYTHNHLYWGYRNQVMIFSGLVLYTNIEGHGQILLDTIPHKDNLATNRVVPHAALFDVEHWNSFYPALPRLVRCDPDILPEYDCEKRKFKSLNGTFHKAPFKSTFRLQYFEMYKQYTQGRGELAKAGYPASADLLIQRGALKLHPKLMEIANSVLRDPASGETIPYMTLHARVEPDMNKHTKFCGNKKVTNLTQIFTHLEAQFPNPSFKRIFMPINRMLLEEGAVVDESNLTKTDWISVDNLRALNHACDYGLWNGTVKVFESGAPSIVGVPYYENYKSLVGAIVDFHIAQHGEVFVGTEVSSFSTDLARVRFFSGNLNNYFYRPDGLHKWTTGDMEHPPPFEC